MKFSNYHQHTTFSDGKNTPEEIVLTAIDLGMESIGFSDHLLAPHEIGLGYNVITESTAPLYHSEIALLKQKYGDKINVFKGVEADLFSILDTSDYDFVIGSVHYLEHNGKIYPIDHTKKQQLEYIDNACGGDLLKFFDNYFNAVYKCIKKYKPDIIGHFDVITKFSVFSESDKEYQKIACDYLEKCLKITNRIEVNTGGVARGFKSSPYPADFILRRALELGAEVILSSDSHNKDTIAFGFDSALSLIKKIGFRSITKLTDKGFIQDEL